MANYMVRMKKRHTVVFIGSASNLANLYVMVAQVCDPHSCEFTELPEDGGIYWSGRCPQNGFHIDAPRVPMQKNGFLDLRDAALTPSWRKPTHRGTGCVWKDGARFWSTSHRRLMIEIAALQRQLPLEQQWMPVPEEFFAIAAARAGDGHGPHGEA